MEKTNKAGAAGETKRSFWWSRCSECQQAGLVVAGGILMMGVDCFASYTAAGQQLVHQVSVHSVQLASLVVDVLSKVG